MTLYKFFFLESAEKEFLTLRAKERRLFSEKPVYLLRNPFKSYPWLRVRQGPRHPGEWRFRLGEFRVFYRVEGSDVVITRIVPRPRAYLKRRPKAGRRRP